MYWLLCGMIAFNVNRLILWSCLLFNSLDGVSNFRHKREQSEANFGFRHWIAPCWSAWARSQSSGRTVCQPENTGFHCESFLLLIFIISFHCLSLFSLLHTWSWCLWIKSFVKLWEGVHYRQGHVGFEFGGDYCRGFCNNKRQLEMIDFAPGATIWRTWQNTSLILAHLLHYMKTWCHPQNRKYIALHCRHEEDMAKSNMHRTFGEIWTCGFWDMQVDRQTGRYADHKILQHYRGKVKIQKLWAQQMQTTQLWTAQPQTPPML